MDVPVPLLLSCLCPTQLLERRGFFSILDRQCMCDLQNLLKVSPKAGLNLSAAGVPGNGQHNKHNSHFFSDVKPSFNSQFICAPPFWRLFPHPGYLQPDKFPS